MVMFYTTCTMERELPHQHTAADRAATNGQSA